VLTSGTLLTFGSSEKSPGWVGPYGLGLFATGRLRTMLGTLLDASPITRAMVRQTGISAKARFLATSRAHPSRLNYEIA
jgi:hypothetical protein